MKTERAEWSDDELNFSNKTHVRAHLPKLFHWRRWLLLQPHQQYH
jgi:hypothetical protein